MRLSILLTEPPDPKRNLIYMMYNPIHPKYVKIIIVFLLFLLAYFCFSLVKEYKYIRKNSEADSYKNIIENLRNKRSLTLEDIDILQSWMTFKYINILFQLPEDFFKNTLYIYDSQYPNISIGKYAKHNGFQKIDILEKVKNSIILHFATSSNPQ